MSVEDRQSPLLSVIDRRFRQQCSALAVSGPSLGWAESRMAGPCCRLRTHHAQRMPREPVSNIYTAINGTPSARRAVRPWPGSEHGRRVHPGRALDRRGIPAAGGWGRRGVSPLGAAAQARCLSVGTHGAGRRRSAVPPHPPPGGPRRHAPPVDGARGAAGPSSRAGHAVAGEDAECPCLQSRARTALRHRCRAGSGHCATSWPGLSRHARPTGA